MKKATLSYSLFFCFFSMYAWATTVIPLDTEDLCQYADVVIVGQVVQLLPQYTRNGRTIDTEAKIQIIEVMKTTEPLSEGDIITVLNPGGKIGNQEINVPGASDLSVHKKGLFFLTHYKNQYAILTLAQGHFLIQTVNGSEIIQKDPKAPSHDSTYLSALRKKSRGSSTVDFQPQETKDWKLFKQNLKQTLKTQQSS